MPLCLRATKGLLVTHLLCCGAIRWLHRPSHPYLVLALPIHPSCLSTPLLCPVPARGRAGRHFHTSAMSQHYLSQHRNDS